MDRPARLFSGRASRGVTFSLPTFFWYVCCDVGIDFSRLCKNRRKERGPSFDIPGTTTVGRNLHVEPRGQTIPPPGLGVDLVGFELAEGKGLPNSQKSRSK